MNNHSHTMAAPQMSVKDLMGDFRLASWETVLLVTGVVLAYKAAAAACGAAYNVFFHPLRRFPGPTTWIAMPWVRNLYHIRGQADRAVVRLHERLGPVVRVAPDTLSFISAAAWKDIYGTGHAELPKHIYKGTGMEERPNIITAHPRDHHRFRKAMQPAFTNDAISREEPLIMSYVDMLIDNLRRIARSPEGEKEGSYSTVNMAKWYTMTTFDIFGDLCYGESFKGLETQSEHPWIQSMGVLKMLVPLLVFPYVSALLPYLLLSAKQRGSLTDHQSRSYGLTMKRIANKDVHPKHDFMTFMLRDRSKDDGLTDHELASNSDIIISAGSETTSTALTGVTYFLARNPDALARCQAEVRGRFDREESVLLPFSTFIDLKLERNGNMNCFGREIVNDAQALNVPCSWVQYWVELDSPSDAGDFKAYLDNYSEQQRASGRFERPANTRLRNVMEWMDFTQVVPGDVRLQMWLAFGFLLVCLVNTVGLLLAKFLRRTSEIGVLRALGATRAMVFQQCLIEAALIGLAGGLGGLLLTAFGLWNIRQQPLAYADMMQLDLTMLGSTLAAAVITTLLAGLLPALRAARIDPALQIKAL